MLPPDGPIRGIDFVCGETIIENWSGSDQVVCQTQRMRADRLIAALMLLQARGRVTAAELAEELEVSERTARRDLEALAMSGVPLYSTAGRGGGWQLIGGARTDLTGLSEDESRSLFVALAQIGKADPVLEATLRKLVVAVPERFREDAQSAATAIRVDPAGWGQIGSAQRPPFVDELSRAVVQGRQCVITYQRPAEDSASDRRVHPLGLVTKRNVWYLVANTDRGVRTYRVSRVSAVQVLEDPVDRPDDFDLDEAWERIVTTVESKRNQVEARIRVSPNMLGPVRWIFGARRVEHGTGDDGWVEMTVAETSPEAIAAQLAGFAPDIEFLEVPDAVVARLTLIAESLSGRWLG